MTAVVGVLNKQAIAIAADSAVTIEGTNGHKIFNKANKVFALSSHHPVGIMLYNHATFMGAPWETIIQVYRKQLGDRCYPTLEDYLWDFLRFLRAKQYFTTAQGQIVASQALISQQIDNLLRQVIAANIGLLQESNEQASTDLLAVLEQALDEILAAAPKPQATCVEFLDYTEEEFERYSQPVLDGIIQHRFIDDGYQPSPALISKLRHWVFVSVCSMEQERNFTGLVIVGFGDDEIYPSLIPLHIGQVIDDRLRYVIDEDWSVKIDQENIAAVRPFAQTDVIETLLTGIDPSLEEIYAVNLKALLDKYNGVIQNRLGDRDPVLAAQIASLDSGILVTEFRNLNQEIRLRDYIRPLIEAVSTLSKEDLAEMAESLIHLTYLKRRITFAEESVGGPVDVAVISKGDGFVWIKRKHYFRPELNPQFFNRYLGDRS